MCPCHHYVNSTFHFYKMFYSSLSSDQWFLYIKFKNLLKILLVRNLNVFLSIKYFKKLQLLENRKNLTVIFAKIQVFLIWLFWKLSEIYFYSYVICHENGHAGRNITWNDLTDTALQCSNLFIYLLVPCLYFSIQFSVIIFVYLEI